MVSMKKIEIIINKPFLKKVLSFLEGEGVKGYTVIEDVIGMGERGLMSGDEVTDTLKNSYIILICDVETSKKVTQNIVPYLKRYGGICVVSDVLYVEH